MITIPQASIGLSHPPQILAGGHAVHGKLRTERYSLDDQWSLHHYHYGFTLEVDGVPYNVKPGSISLLPPGTNTLYRFPRKNCEHDYCIFTLHTEGPMHTTPMIRGATSYWRSFSTDFTRLIGQHKTRPTRASVTLWELLWQLVDGAAGNQAPEGDVIDQVAWRIKNRLNHTLRVAELAAEAKISHNLLTRRFYDRFGITVIGYIQRERMKLAKRLLVETSLPVKVIAVEVGLPDPQHFNKAVHRMLGASPSQIRAGA